jgi:predicted metal-binding protein
MPIEWVKRNEIAHKDELDVIVSGAIMVLPPHEVDENEMEEIIRDFRAMVQIRNKMRSYQSMAEIRD